LGSVAPCCFRQLASAAKRLAGALPEVVVPAPAPEAAADPDPLEPQAAIASAAITASNRQTPVFSAP
jgi:hypothetical protein